ncbi:MAG: NUDIX hydrolase [Clostridia bacterium]|nr:NUDIX hydrolase [Clostridia bacterium]
MEELRDKNGLTEAEFLASYDASKYERPSVTVDVIIIHDGKLLLIKRGGHPCIHKLAFPGGFIEPFENVYSAAARELMEETGLTARNLRQINVASEPKRDPRTRIITVPFIAEVADISALKAGDDADSARLYPFSYKKTRLGDTEITEITILDNGERKSVKVTKTRDKSGLCGDYVYKQAGNSMLAGDHAEILARAIDAMNL